jgi:hypothetical protein
MKVLPHDDARPHTAGQTTQTINHLCFVVLERPAYSTDIALLSTSKDCAL